MAKKSVYEIVTERIMEKLRQGEIPSGSERGAEGCGLYFRGRC
jgi:hypothetical protein